MNKNVQVEIIMENSRTSDVSELMYMSSVVFAVQVGSVKVLEVILELQFVDRSTKLRPGILLFTVVSWLKRRN